MAVNILGTVTAQAHGDSDFRLPPITTFESSVEPMSISSIFKNKQWRHLRKFTQVTCPDVLNT